MTGEQLRHLREQAGLSRQQLADRIGTTHGRIHGAEARGPRDAAQQAAILDGLTRGGELELDASDGPPGSLGDLRRGDLIKHKEADGTVATMAFVACVPGPFAYVDAVEPMPVTAGAKAVRNTGQWRSLHPDRVLDMRGRPLAVPDGMVPSPEALASREAFEAATTRWGVQ